MKLAEVKRILNKQSLRKVKFFTTYEKAEKAMLAISRRPRGLTVEGNKENTIFWVAMNSPRAFLTAEGNLERPVDCDTTKVDKYEAEYTAKSAAVDPDVVDDLKMYVENDGDIYRQSIVPAQKNLMRKMVKGTYDSKLAPKLWAYVVEYGRQKYRKEHGGALISRENMMEVAKQLAEEFEDRVKNNEFSPQDFDVKGEVQVTW